MVAIESGWQAKVAADDHILTEAPELGSSRHRYDILAGFFAGQTQFACATKPVHFKKDLRPAMRRAFP